MEDLTTPLVISFFSGFAVLAALTLTSFMKISIVFMILRQALGLQQVPANIVLMTLSIFVAVFISMPVFSEAIAALTNSGVTPATPADIVTLWNLGISPFQDFLLANIDPAHLDFFLIVSEDLWEGSGFSGSRDDFIIQVPSFMISELTEAFRIGFLIYLPFVSIDIAVTAILMALGMQMVQPNIIATPFKLLTFVYVDGWARITEGLVMGYTGV